AQHVCVGSGNEREGGQHELVPRTYVEQQRRHLQGVGARRGQEAFADPKLALEQRLALRAEPAVPHDVAALDRLAHVRELVADRCLPVERNRHRSGVGAVGDTEKLFMYWWASGPTLNKRSTVLTSCTNGGCS